MEDSRLKSRKRKTNPANTKSAGGA